MSSGQFSRDFVHKFLPLSTVYFDKEKGGEIKWTLATTVTTNRSTTSSEKLPPVRHKIKYVLIQWVVFSKLYRMEPRQNSFILLLWPDLLWHHQCYRLSCLFIGLKAWILTITCVWTMKGYFWALTHRQHARVACDFSSKFTNPSVLFAEMIHKQTKESQNILPGMVYYLHKLCIYDEKNIITLNHFHFRRTQNVSLR